MPRTVNPEHAAAYRLNLKPDPVTVQRPHYSLTVSIIPHLQLASSVPLTEAGRVQLEALVDAMRDGGVPLKHLTAVLDAWFASLPQPATPASGDPQKGKCEGQAGTPPTPKASNHGGGTLPQVPDCSTCLYWKKRECDRDGSDRYGDRTSPSDRCDFHEPRPGVA